MPAPRQSRPRRKEDFTRDFNVLGKPVVFSESTGRTSSLAPNIRSLSWAPLGNLIAYSIVSHIRVWDPERANIRQSIELRTPGTTGHVESVEFSPVHEAVLASTGADGLCRLWDIRLPGGAAIAGKGTTLAECSVGEGKHGMFLTWHPKGQELIVGCKDDAVQLVDVRRMAPPYTPNSEAAWETIAQEKTPTHGEEGHFGRMRFSNTGEHLIIPHGDSSVEIVKWPSLENHIWLNGHAGGCHVTQHSPSGRYMATGGDDGILNLWNTTNWFVEHAIPRSSCAIRDLSFSFDGEYIVVGGGLEGAKSGPSNLKITHVETADDIIEVDTTNPVTWTAWHPLRYFLAYTGDPGGLKILGVGSNVL